MQADISPPFQKVRQTSTTARALFFSIALSTKPTAPVHLVFRDSAGLAYAHRATHCRPCSLFWFCWSPGRFFPPRALSFFFTPIAAAAPGPSSVATPAAFTADFRLVVPKGCKPLYRARFNLMNTDFSTAACALFFFSRAIG